MNWMVQAQQRAAKHPTIVKLRSSAKRHRQESSNNLAHSASDIREHAMWAQQFDATANRLEMEMVAKAGVEAGEWKSYLVGHNREVGSYIQVMTDQGWNPDYFWCEDPQPVSAESAALM
ncbi:MAG: hypothetical protein KGZ70_12840 [Hydrogenophaga sp.]|nr:hypothetical protein [Hydrogenophaga sp.]